jgi:very-short-patch-repair endonuclease
VDSRRHRFATFGIIREVKWSSRASAQSGVISHTQLQQHGLAASTVRSMLSTEALTAVARGVYLVRGAPLTYRARLWTAVLGTQGTLGFATAAELWGAIESRSAAIHVVVPHSRRIYPPEWVRVHRTSLPGAHRTDQAELPVTTRPWSLFDYLPTLSAGAPLQLADRALQRGWFTRDELDARLRETPCRHGNRRLRLLLATIGDGAAAESERRLHALLRRAGITGWVPNHPVWAHGELIAVVDVAIAHRRLAIEVDGMAYHVDAERFQRDRSRQNELVLSGWTVLRFTWSDLTTRPDWVIAQILAALGRQTVA